MTGMMGGWVDALFQAQGMAAEDGAFRHWKGRAKPPPLCSECHGSADERVRHGLTCAGCARKTGEADVH